MTKTIWRLTLSGPIRDKKVVKNFQIHERLKIELDELRREIGRNQNQLNYVQLEVKMPDSDGSDNGDTPGKGFVTLAELRKYIMMAADEMSTSMKT